MNTAARFSLATPLRTQLLSRPIQRTLTTTPTTMPIISNINHATKSQYTKTERRAIGLASVVAGTAGIGAGLYYYVSNKIDAIEEAF